MPSSTTLEKSLDTYLPIPIANGVAFIDTPSSGRCEPIIMRCDVNGNFQDYYVKLIGNSALHFKGHSLAREVFGTLLAKSLNLGTPDIAFVKIDSELLAPFSPESHTQAINASNGINFGSKLITGNHIVVQKLQPEFSPQAIKIFCFDMFIGNVDRRFDRPNAFVTKDGYVIFDHEQAFTFSKSQPSSFFGIPPVWEYIKEPWPKDHLFFSSLHKKDCGLEIEEFITSLGGINERFLDTIDQQIPIEWRDVDAQLKIRKYLLEAIQNRNLFQRSLQEILA